MASGSDALYVLVQAALHLTSSRKLSLYGLGLILSPKTTWPRFSTGDWVSSDRQKSKWWYSNGISDSSVLSRFTYNGISFWNVYIISM